MKVLISQLKKYLPTLEASLEEIVQVYTKIGYMLDGQPETVEFMGQEDFLLDLEVRQNRVDLLGVQGLARELSAYYDIPMQVEEFQIDVDLENKPNVEIKATDAVKRVMAIEISDVNVSESPEWLKNYLAVNGINSINNIVDLTNYVMLETAHTSHAFDLDLIDSKKLVWEYSKLGEKFMTLDGTELELDESILNISDGNTPLSLFMIGGKSSGINMNTKNIILEMAIYDGGAVRRNSRKLKITTEAGGRLEKYLDPETIPFAFSMLVAKIIEITGGKVSSGTFDEYIDQTKSIEIWTDLDKVQQIAGIEIDHNESVNYLERLGFQIKERQDSKVLVLRPLNRLDIEQEEDVFEEIIRLKGYDCIPTDRLFTQPVKDVTPKRLYMIDDIKRLLVANGLDEVRSWVLVNETNAFGTKLSEEEVVKVQNSINDEVPYLRPSLISNLTDQALQLSKQSVSEIEIFEVGKVFEKIGTEYSENYSLSILSNTKSIDKMRILLERILLSFGIEDIRLDSTDSNIDFLHPNDSFDVIVKNIKIGVLGLLNKSSTNFEGTVLEINLDLLDKFEKEVDSSKELTQKLVSLDSNIITNSKTDLQNQISEYRRNNSDVLWDISVLDEFKMEEGNTRYTVRFIYFNLTDQEAKVLHSKTFK